MRAATWLLGLTVLGPCAAAGESIAPAYTAAGRLVRPADYREWVFVTSGLGMTYGPAQHAAGSTPPFDNVFVTRDAHRAFLDGGAWPDGTMFVLEIRRAESGVSIDTGGRTQGDVVALEASVKDRSRFGGNGWAYFSFDGPQGFLDDAAPLPATAACHSCHASHAAVDNTFVQFYPTLREAARRHGRLSPHAGRGAEP